ncbi:MAG: 50S ribosomal protein L22 [Armatimonadetes bacterium]|nr:50S ribosomal protein L22 [Armatimonadota bacterium]
MEVRAVAKFVKCKPLMVRQVAREIRGYRAVEAANILRFKPGKGAFHLHKVLMSAIANAEANHEIDADTLKISSIQIDEGPKTKRIQARAMGRANRIFKRTAHIMVAVEEVGEEVKVKPHGTAAKKRPTLAAPKGRGAKPAAAKKEAKAAEAVVEETVVEEQIVETPVEETVVETPVEAAAEAEATSAEEAGEEKQD